jgi:hypothetical protein
MRTSLRATAPCAPAEAKERLRDYLTSLGLESSESTTDNKTFLIETDFIAEPPHGRRDKQVRYRLTVKPAADANASSVEMDFDVQSRGIREGDWQDESSTGIEPQHKQPLLKQLPNICRPQQQ